MTEPTQQLPARQGGAGGAPRRTAIDTGRVDGKSRAGIIAFSSAGLPSPAPHLALRQQLTRMDDEWTLTGIMNSARLPPLDFPLALNPTAHLAAPACPSVPSPSSSPSSQRHLITRAILPFSFLVDYIGPHSPTSWSRPGSPPSPASRLPRSPSSFPPASHVLGDAPHPRARACSRSFRLRTRPSPAASPPAPHPLSSLHARAALDPEPPTTPPASPLSRRGYAAASPPLSPCTLSLAPSSNCPCARCVAPPQPLLIPTTSPPPLLPPPPTAADESQKVVKVVASHGRTGDQIELSYSSTKVVGNGSFGVVFAAKLGPNCLGPDNEGDDDVAIKKVLQDKRFKVRCSALAFILETTLTSRLVCRRRLCAEPRVADHEARAAPQRGQPAGILLLER